MRSRVLAALLVAATVTAAATAADAATPTRFRVTLTAKDHHPVASHSPSAHWWYCVKVTTTTGKSVASTIHVQIVSGRKVVRKVALITLRKGYDHWCQAIGGEASLLNVVPKGKRLIFQAIVTAGGVTVKRNWQIVVR